MDFQNLSFSALYTANGQNRSTRSLKNEHFEIKISTADDCLFSKICPKTAVAFSKISFELPYSYQKDSKIFVNGYQSWTDSLEYSVGESMHELSRLTEFCITKTPVKAIGFPKSGDSLFHKFPRKPNFFYGWSYGYVRSGENLTIFGSLDERSGFTCISFDVEKGCVIIEKELEGVTFEQEKELLSFGVIGGGYDEAFDRYFEKAGITCRTNKRRTGYTTWYNYYGNINEQVVFRDLKSINELDINFDCFQIDDGYQAAIGDWLVTDKKKFPHGMKHIADEIHRNNMEAGLWLAPFAATPRSRLFKEHPDFFIKGKNGKPYKTGHNWGGFYSVDIYNKSAREYIRKVFDTVLNDWGFDLVKLDFLYGACVLPMHNKSRGEIMCDAMDFLRECCGDKLILGCGVPLMPAFGKVDYCRIGSDISLKWQRSKHIIREDVSTPHAVSNSIFRRHLDGRAWCNDPDVFLLRDSNIKLSFEQRKLLARINSLFGNLLFISDNVGEYSPEQKKVLTDTFAPQNTCVHSAEFVKPDVMEIGYSEDGIDKVLRFNIRTGIAE